VSSNYDAEIYDIFHSTSFMGDIEFYVAEAQEAGGPVLELGAGTGRIAFAIAQGGVSVTALEFDPGMLSRMRHRREEASEAIRRRLACVQGDMRDFRLDERFERVFIPFRAFNHNLERDHQLACLRCVREHLAPGGKLLLNTFHPSLDFMGRNSGPLEGVWRLVDERELADGSRILRSEANRYDTVRQLVHSRHRFERFAENGRLVEVHLQVLDMTYFYPSQLREVLLEAGFADATVYGGFHRGPLEHDQDELVVEATAPTYSAHRLR